MRPGKAAPHSETLTPRERDVLQLLATGSTMKQAARVLGITARTVAFHKYRIMARLHLQTNTEVILFAIREGIVRVNKD